MLADGTMKIGEKCMDARDEFGMYKWDEKATSDKVIKENDHAMDDIRYFAHTVHFFSVYSPLPTFPIVRYSLPAAIRTSAQLYAGCLQSNISLDLKSRSASRCAARKVPDGHDLPSRTFTRFQKLNHLKMVTNTTAKI